MEQLQSILPDSVSKKNMENSAALWSFLPLTAYTPPSYPARGAFEKNWKTFKQIFRKHDEKEVFKGEEELRKLEESRLTSLLVEPDWKDLAESLDSWFENRNETRWKGASVRFLVGPPGGGGETCWSKIVEQWAVLHNAAIITPPSCEEVLTGDNRWLDEIQATENPWVLPHLEDCYLRHIYGLTGIRRFFELVEKNILAPGLVACDSWAWRLFGKLWPVAQLDAFTLKEFDGDRLLSLLSVLTRCKQGRTVRYCNSISGDEIFSTGEKSEKVNSEIIKLAAYSRGNLAIALQLWRSRLRTEPDEERSEAEAASTASVKGGVEDTIWVAPDFFNPTLPQEKIDFPLILHALLLHNGLPEHVLPKILPVTRAKCMGILSLLEDSGVAEQKQGAWFVSSLGYGLVREYLQGHDYLVDMF